MGKQARVNAVRKAAGLSVDDNRYRRKPHSTRTIPGTCSDDYGGRLYVFSGDYFPATPIATDAGAEGEGWRIKRIEK
jgi:hypothetical protein